MSRLYQEGKGYKIRKVGYDQGVSDFREDKYSNPPTYLTETEAQIWWTGWRSGYRSLIRG